MDVARRNSIIFAVAPFCVAAAFWWMHPYLAIDADTPRYLANDPMRTATYPLFLDLTYGPALLPLQLFLFAGALAWLAIYAARFLPLALTAALVLTIGANPYLWELQATIMSEALTTPLLTLIVGCIVGFAATRKPALLVFAALFCGIAASIRPPCIALIAAPIAAALLAPGLKGRGGMLALVVVACAAPVVVERVYSRMIHGENLASPIGRHAFMKAAVIDAPETTIASNDPLDQRLVRALNQDFRPVRRLLHEAPSWQVRYTLLTNYEACAAWGCGDLILKGVNRPRPDIDSALLHVGMARLKTNPIGYLELSATEYHRMWLLHPRKHPGLAPLYNNFLARHSPLPFQLQLGIEGKPTPAAEQKSSLRFNRAAFAGVGIVAALMTAVAGLLWRRSPSQAALPLLLGSQAVLVLSAFTAVGLPRYAMGMWPMIIAGIFMGGLGLLDARLEARSRRER